MASDKLYGLVLAGGKSRRMGQDKALLLREGQSQLSYIATLLERVAGRGTFVSDLRSQTHLVAVQNIADEINARGHRHSSKVVRQSRQHARGEIAKALHISQGTDVFHLLLIHFENGSPIQVEDRHVLAAFAPACLEQDFESETPSAYLTSTAPLQEAEHVVRAAMPDDETRQTLAMNGGEPCLVVNRRTWAHGRPVTFARLWHPGDRFELSGHYAPPGADDLD